MRTVVVSIVLVVLAGIASAQPGQTPMGPPPPQQGPPPAGMVPYGYPPPYQPDPLATLTPEERSMVARGEISMGLRLGGTFLAYFVGFGSGQAVQGRWDERGSLFAIGEAGSLGGILVYAIACGNRCNNDTEVEVLLTGLVAWGVFRIWGILDALIAPSFYNDRVHELRGRVGYPDQYSHRITPYLAPIHDGGGVAGVALRF